MKREHEALISSPVFEGIRPKEIETLLDSLRAYEKPFKKGEIICEAGAKMDVFPVVLKGRVRASLVQGSRRQVVAWFSRGESFAEAVPVSLKNSPVEIQAIEDSLILFIPSASLTGLLSASGYRLHANLMMEMSKKVAGLSEKLSLLTEARLSDRVLRYLATLPQNEDGSITLPLKYTELAEYLGVNKTSLSRTMHIMEDEGQIIMKGRTICVLQDESEKPQTVTNPLFVSGEFNTTGLNTESDNNEGSQQPDED